jgi:hypothetical protein
MDNQQVEISAAAAGTIVSKSDGNFDRSCTFNNNQWNAVYVYQADGSVGWYGHMKSGSLTLKGVGASVAAGEYLGRVGSSGSSTATFTIGLTPFTDTALIPGATPIRAVHVAELRARIDAIRAHLGLAGYPWTDAPLSANTTMIKAVHMTELRAALAEAYMRSGRPAPIYATPAPAPGQPVIAGTIVELRTAVAAIE